METEQLLLLYPLRLRLSATLPDFHITGWPSKFLMWFLPLHFIIQCDPKMTMSAFVSHCYQPLFLVHKINCTHLHLFELTCAHFDWSQSSALNFAQFHICALNCTQWHSMALILMPALTYINTGCGVALNLIHLHSFAINCTHLTHLH